MKKHYLISGCLLIATIFTFITTYAQNATEILMESYAKCRNIQNGHYLMTKHTKFMDKKDTMIESFNCYFRKLGNDSLYPNAFHDMRILNGKLVREELFSFQQVMLLLHGVCLP